METVVELVVTLFIFFPWITMIYGGFLLQKLNNITKGCNDDGRK